MNRFLTVVNATSCVVQNTPGLLKNYNVMA